VNHGRADHRLEELFVRYWDDASSPAEMEELEQLLEADPLACGRFRQLCMQAVAVADLPTFTEPRPVRVPAPSVPPPLRTWTRRRVLHYLGWGVAACAVAGPFAGHFGFDRRRHVRVASVQGTVTVQTTNGVVAPLKDVVPLGATVSTHGTGSSAVLHFGDGSGVCFLGDSQVTVGEDGRHLLLHRGTACAEIPTTRTDDALSPILATSEATLTEPDGVMTLGRALEATEVGVHKGQVSVATAAGKSLGVVRGGEILTVNGEGKGRKQALPATPEEFGWDLSRPLPGDWHVGIREVTPEGPVVRPEFWFDPYHQAKMWQIRSDKQWARGFCSLHADSVIWIRYWVEKPGPSQFCTCVRTERPPDPSTGMLEYDGAFTRARPRQWQWLEVKAGEMLDNIHVPQFGAPWVSFLFLFNTYREDLGLRIAALRMTRRGDRPPGA